MKKTIYLFILFFLTTSFIYAQQIENVQVYASSVFVQGSTPTNPDLYQWEQIENNLQGVNIDVGNTEITLITIQQNNAKLAVNTLDHPYGFIKLDIKYDDDEWLNVHEGSTVWSVGWLDLPETFQTIGGHSLEIRFYKPGVNQPFFREYEVEVGPASSGFHRDNTQITDPTNPSDPFVTGNTLTVWENPNQNENTKPFLIIEGYDVSNSVYAEFYRFSGDLLVNELFNLNYDIYILNLSLGSADIRGNAAVLHSAIEYISSINDDDNVAVMGLSMGGLIGRYALAKAEEDGNPLPASSFSSMDSPQQGAVLDSEFQDWIKSKISSFPNFDNPAAKQMLIYNAYDEDSMHESFYSELNSLNGNGYPNTIPTIGIAFSNNQPNPNLDEEWLALGIDFLNDQHYYVKEEWGVSGSLLPRSSTMLDPIRSLLLRLIAIDVTFDRRSDPTFIPYESALDIVDGESKFCFTIELPEGSDLAFHDQIPPVLASQYLRILRLQILDEIGSNEVYNFTQLITNYLREDLTIFGEMHINGSDNFSGSSLDPKPANPRENYQLSTSPCESLELTVENNAKLIIGESTDQKGDLVIRDNSLVNVKTGGDLEIKSDSRLILNSGAVAEISGILQAQFGGQVIIKDGASLRVANGGTLRMIHSSNLIVEDGGQLIIEDGANIDLWDNNNHRAHISVFGELVINGQLSIGGSGYFKFNKGNKVTFGPNISEFVFTGNDQDHRFFVIGEDATLAFGEMPIRLMNGIIEYEASSTISIEGAPYVNLQTLRLNGLSGSGIAVSTERVPSLDLLSCSFSNLQTGLSSQNDGTGTMLVRGCEFSESVTGISTTKVEGVDLQYCRFSNLQTGLNALNNGTGTVLLRGCNFELCRYGLFNGGQERVDVYSSNFSGENLEVGMAMLLFGIPNVSMTSTDIVDYNGPAYRNDYELGDHQEGINHPAISLSHDEGITNLSMYGCFVRNNKIGVLLEEGANDFSDGNIFVRDRTTFQENETGILMWRGRHQAFNEAGLVLLDCARMIDNEVGVKGIDVLLQVDAEENCLECVGNPNTQIRPNTLIAPWLPGGPANIFDICYQEFEVTEVPAKGNYWNGIFPSDVPLDQMWRFRTNMNCNGFVDDNILDPTNHLPTEPTNCPDESPNDDCPPGQICVVNPPNDKIVIVEIEGNTYNVHSQYAAAYQDFRNENLTRSKERFMPIAGIPDEIKKNLNGVGNHYIDVARVMVNALQEHQNENQAGLNNEDSYSDTYDHLWLTENKQSAPTKALEDLWFTVHPNPANDQVIVGTVSGDYELSVYNVLGSLVYRTKINQRIILEVTDWEKGLYTIELKDLNNRKNIRVQKLIIQ